jgi:hypothetical protein
MLALAGIAPENFGARDQATPLLMMDGSFGSGKVFYAENSL